MLSVFLILQILHFFLTACSESCVTKPPARTNQVRPRDAAAKKQQSAAAATATRAGGATATRHKEGAPGAKKAAKTTGKAGASTQAKANPRHTNTTSRGVGKFSWRRLKPAVPLRAAASLPVCRPAWKMCRIPEELTK